MSKTAIAPGIYFDDVTQRYTYRPTNRRTGRRTEKRLKARTLAKAILEYDKIVNAPAKEINVTELADLYTAANCPDRRGVERHESFVTAEEGRIEFLKEYFCKLPAGEIRLKDCLEYKAWRVKRLERSDCTGERAVDMELTTLSNILNYGVLIEEVEVNRIQHNRPKFRSGRKVEHCRDKQPRSGDELHILGAQLFEIRKSQSYGWQMFFEALTGCRTSEILMLRKDAKPGEPGYVDGSWLYIQRAKAGDNPYIFITPELRSCLDAFNNWHALTWNGKQDGLPKSPWYFPSVKHGGADPVDKNGLCHALQRMAKSLLTKEGEPEREITSHGLRAFYVTWRRSVGDQDAKIAGDLGHRSGGATLIWTTYGQKPPNWTGGPEFGPMPLKVPIAWERWIPATEGDNILQFKVG